MWPSLPPRADVPPTPAERAAALARLLVWARDNGARWDGIEFRVDERGSARAVAIRSLAPGESVLEVPDALIIDTELAGLGLELHSRDTLAVWLALQLRDSTSRWRPYLEALPVRLSEFPMFRDADDLAALAGTAAYALAEATNRDVLDVYERLPPETRARVSLGDLAWGRLVVMSRAFRAPKTLDDQVALLPLVEIFNHRSDDVTSSHDPIDGLVVRTTREIAQGDEVCFSYGHRSNSHLLVHYGFILADNTANEADLVFEVPSGDPIRVRVASMFDDRLAHALSLARLLACDAAERERILASLTEPTLIRFLGGATEEKAWDVLGDVARRARAGIEEPRDPTPRDTWGQTCALVRAGERAILDHVIELAGAARAHAHDDRQALLASATAIPLAATGAQLMLRAYLGYRAEEPAPS